MVYSRTMRQTGRSRPAKRKIVDDPAQSRAFVEKAREIEADEESSRADDLLGRLARTPPGHKAKTQHK
jgi:hypothetical protein